jgi:peptidoglycan/xylan/chitin deacetylase (PgdA/CDA1 family)
MLALTDQRRRGYCIIFYYHAISTADRNRFAAQMDVAMKWSSPIAVGCTKPLQDGKTYFSVTFDDALQSVADNALPELRRRNIPTTIFVVTRSLDQLPTWIKQECHTSTTDKVMSADTLKNSMSDLVVYGSHSLTHPYLSHVDDAEACRQITLSRFELQSLLGVQVTLFSFPYGAFDEDHVRSCRDAGYQRVFTTLPRPAIFDPEEFVCGRIVVDPTDWSLEFFLKLQGAYSWLPWAFSLKRNLKLAFHLRKRDQHVSRLKNESQNP